MHSVKRFTGSYIVHDETSAAFLEHVDRATWLAVGVYRWNGRFQGHLIGRFETRSLAEREIYQAFITKPWPRRYDMMLSELLSKTAYAEVMASVGGR